MESEWKHEKFSSIVNFSNKRKIKKGKLAPFISMPDIETNQRDIINYINKEYIITSYFTYFIKNLKISFK